MSLFESAEAIRLKISIALFSEIASKTVILVTNLNLLHFVTLIMKINLVKTTYTMWDSVAQ